MVRNILKVGIMPKEQYRKRTIAIAKGAYIPKHSEPKVWFESLKGTLKNSFIVIPAKAGIQSNHTDGFRVKPGMTNYSRLP